VIGNGQKFTMFWDRVQSFQQIASHWLHSKICKVIRNKMGHHQAWCCQVHWKLHCCAYALWIKDRFWKYVSQSFELVQNKASKASSFHIPSCSICVERRTSWVDMQEEMKNISSPMKRKTNLGDCSNIDNDGL
jgi:hypothetical protein